MRPIRDYCNRKDGEVTNTTPTGIPVTKCPTCGDYHPITRHHCNICGKASLFGHDFCRETATQAQQNGETTPFEATP